MTSNGTGLSVTSNISEVECTSNRIQNRSGFEDCDFKQNRVR